MVAEGFHESCFPEALGLSPYGVPPFARKSLHKHASCRDATDIRQPSLSVHNRNPAYEQADLMTILSDTRVTLACLRSQCIHIAVVVCFVVSSLLFVTSRMSTNAGIRSTSADGDEARGWGWPLPEMMIH